MIGAIEAGGTKIVVALAQADGTIVARARIPTDTPDATFGKLRGFFAESANAHGAITGFGIGSFGPLDVDPLSPAYGTITTTPKPGWSGARWSDALAGFAVPLVVDSDVNAAALGEWARGAGRGCRTIAYTTVGTGIGSGIVTDGQALRGFSHYETGHVPTPRDPALDPFAGCCPFHGDCLEGVASGPAIAERWGGDLSQLPGHLHAVELIADYLAHLATTLVLTHMPERLIFGGGVMKAPGLLEALRRRTGDRLAGYVTLPCALAEMVIAPQLGDDAGIAGALELARRAGSQTGKSRTAQP
jgi:fructokinase